MKKTIPVVMLMCAMLCACGGKDNNVVNEEKTEDKKEVVVLSSDLTKDGIDDEIKINIYAAKDIDSANKYADIDTVEVFSGKTGEKIWGKRVSLIHMEQDGLYIYNDGENDYILEMCLYMNQGNAVYKYSVLDLGEDGVVTEKICEDIGFSVNEDERKEEDIENIKKFEKNINEYLNESYVILDTNYDSDVVYSTKDNKVELTYDASEILEELS